MANPVFDVVRSVLAIRQYQDRSVPADVVGRVLDAGRLTASAASHGILSSSATAAPFES